MEPLRVSADEFQRDIARYRDVALSRPVAVTEDGRERTVLLSIDEYERLKGLDREVLSLGDFTDADLAALELSRPTAASAAYDCELDR
jgi:PHD/YefM family antitoxin component YafN of YafNO toxin-antitoxin module